MHWHNSETVTLCNLLPTTDAAYKYKIGHQLLLKIGLQEMFEEMYPNVLWEQSLWVFLTVSNLNIYSD
jgi:hypothetical protein